MIKEIKPHNLSSNFKFELKNLPLVELKDWPVESSKIITRWNIAISVFEKYLSYLSNNIVYYSPYPVNAVSIGAAEARDTLIIVRLFLFPMLKPNFQMQSIGQIVYKFGYNANPENIEISLDFLRLDEMTQEQIVELEKAVFYKKMEKLENDFPGKIRYLVNESEVEKINFDAVFSEPKTFANFNPAMLEYIQEELEKNNEIAIMPISKDMLTILSSKNLFKK
jgi:hypothetical protein